MGDKARTAHVWSLSARLMNNEREVPGTASDRRGAVGMPLAQQSLAGSAMEMTKA